MVGRDTRKSWQQREGHSSKNVGPGSKESSQSQGASGAGGPCPDLGPCFSQPGGIASCAQAQSVGFLKQNEEGVDP